MVIGIDYPHTHNGPSIHNANMWPAYACLFQHQRYMGGLVLVWKANVKNSIKGILYDFDTILWQKYKNRFFGVFSLWKWFLVSFKGTRT